MAHNTVCYFKCFHSLWNEIGENLCL